MRASLPIPFGPSAKILRLFFCCGLVLLLLGGVAARYSHAQPRSFPEPPPSEFIIGTKIAPPFAMRSKDGGWNGISVDLWTQLAEELHIEYRFEEMPDVETLIEATAEGSLDAAIGALTITAERERALDFSQPFYITGLGIAVPVDREWQPLMIARAASSFGFGQAAVTLGFCGLGLAVIIAVLEYFGRRRSGQRESSEPYAPLSEWWTYRARGTAGSMLPTTLAGRFLGMIWIVIMVVALASLALMLALNLSAGGTSSVNSIADLPHARVGAVHASPAADYLGKQKIAFRSMANVAEGLKAVRDGELDGFVHDRPLLAWMVLQQFASSVEVLPDVFDLQSYAIALKPQSPLRSQIDPLIIETVHSESWQDILSRYLGSD